MYRLIQFLYFSNIITSLTGAFLALGILKKLGIDHQNWYPEFIFFAVLVTYTYQRWRRYIQLIHTHSEHVEWIKSNQWIHFGVFIAGLIGSSFYMLSHIHLFFRLLPWLILPVFISIWYVHSFFCVIFREIPYVKSFTVVITWLVMVLWVPVFLFGCSANLIVLHLSIFHFFLLFGVLILFDIRDIEYDISKIKTLPLLVGERWSRWLAIYCFLVAIGYSLFTNSLNYIELILPVVLILQTVFAKPKGPVFYFALLDLLLASQGLIYYLD